MNAFTFGEWKSNFNAAISNDDLLKASFVRISADATVLFRMGTAEPRDEEVAVDAVGKARLVVEAVVTNRHFVVVQQHPAPARTTAPRKGENILQSFRNFHRSPNFKILSTQLGTSRGRGC
jgi:hypothetical protein